MLAVLRMLGLFDRPVDEKVLGALLRSPAIPGLTEPLTDLDPTEWRMLLARLRGQDFSLQKIRTIPGNWIRIPRSRILWRTIQSQRSEAWKECNRRLYHYYRVLAPQLPDSFREMEPLFLAVICGCPPVYFAKRCMKFTFRGFSEAMLPSQPTSSGPEAP